MKKAMITKLLITAILASLMVLTACSSSSKTNSPHTAFKKFSEKQLFERGELDLSEGSYQEAVTVFETLDARYPFSPYSEQAQLDIIYAYYKTGDNASTAAAADRYIQLYPTNQHVEYAYYMKGLANFEQDRGILLRYFPIDESKRDLGTAIESYQDFKILVERFPQSRYAADARQRMIYLRNSLAKHELYVAEFYMQRRSYIAAINRANNIIRNYPHAPSTKQALILLVKANRHLGLMKEADQMLRVLSLNYPNSLELKKLEGKAEEKKSYFSFLSR